MRAIINWLAEYGLLAFMVIFLCGTVTVLSIGQAMPWVDLQVPGCIWLAVCGTLLTVSVLAISVQISSDSYHWHE